MNGRVQEFLISRARKIERALVRRSWTRVHLAELTGYDERTIRNVLGAKPVRDQTIIDICQALGIEPDLEDSSEYVEVADAEYGIRAGRIADTRVATSLIAAVSIRSLA